MLPSALINPLYANVSAVIGCVKWDMLKPLPITVVHNPLAAIALPRVQGDRYLLRPFTEPPG